MYLTIGTSALIAVIGNEKSKDRIIELTESYSLYAPASVHSLIDMESEAGSISRQ